MRKLTNQDLDGKLCAGGEWRAEWCQWGVNRDVVCEECGRTFRRESDNIRGISAGKRGRNHCGSNMEPLSVGYARGGSVAKVAWQCTGAHDLLETESYFHSLYGVAWPLCGSKYTGQNRHVCMYVCMVS